MNSRGLFLTIILAVFIGIPIAIVIFLTQPDIHIFEGVEGPKQQTVVLPYEKTSWTQYSGGSISRLSILLTDPDSSWLGLAHGLKSLGVPFTITDDYQEAIKHKTILVYPNISGAVLTQDALRAISRFPRDGGVLIGSFVEGGGLQDVFGFAEAVPSRDRFRLNLSEQVIQTDEPHDAWVPLGSLSGSGQAIGTYAYTSPRETPLATYEDGSSAITHRRIGNGAAYALGIDIGALVLKGHNNREEGYARSYVNGYEPAIDTLLRVIKSIYEQSETETVTLHPVPQAKQLAVLITHDIDYTRSLKNSIDYAKVERELGVPATFYIQTKYMRDWNDDIILDQDAPEILRRLDAMGMEIASHGVSHSLAFADFPFGDGSEAYPSYQPFVKDKTTTTNGTILGELRVSRFLLEELTDLNEVTSFRPGHLLNPFTLPQAMSATGYRYSSSVTANNALSHLPFQLNQDRRVESELPIFEFPVTIEDEESPKLGDRLEDAVTLAEKIALHGGLCVVLVHPDVLDHKLSFVRDFVSAVDDFSWFGTVNDYGEWWVARNDVQVDLLREGENLKIRLQAPRSIKNLALNIPAGFSVNEDRTNPVGILIVKDRLVIPHLHGQEIIELKKR